MVIRGIAPVKNYNGETEGVGVFQYNIIEVEKNLLQMRNVLILLGIVFIIMSILLAWFILKNLLAVHLKVALETTEEIAKGNLTQENEVKLYDEVGYLCDNINKRSANLNHIVTKISKNANILAFASNEISSSSELLSQGAIEQASSRASIFYYARSCL